MAEWKLDTSEDALSTPWLVVRKKTYAHAGGSHDYYVVERAPFVLAVAIDAAGDLVMVRHFRQGTDRQYLELPAGYIEGGETAEAAAIRELREETGFTARRAQTVAELHPLPGYVRSAAFVVLCEDLVSGGAADDRDEIDEIVRVPWAKATEMILNGEIIEMQAVAAIFLIKERERASR